MDILKAAEKAMSMDENTWNRHASPLSVYSRFTILPLFTGTLAIRDELGGYTVVVIAFIILWVWLNPRIFPAPKTTNNWASMVTFGERIYLKRNHENLIPQHHLTACRNLMVLQIIGLPFWLYGLYSMNLELMIFGALWLMVTKAWFVDRMVWLYQDVKDLNPEYQSWLRS
ncbi:hypothetical protein L4C33_12020 [Vibrio makurazakiensis]|uniref:DUF6653 family protein n=1 Tax=Vibrio makurazakiensis TaxID=2910250 RepID=UPI003D0A0A24